MDNYAVEILERALRDITEIYEYIRRDKEDAAAKVYCEIRNAIADLRKFPFRGGAVDKDDISMNGYRFIVVKPYLIFYKVRGDKITVYHVLDGRRDYLKILT